MGLSLLRLLTFVGLCIHLLLLFRPAEQLVSRPFQEDAFYSLSVSRSLAEGKGLSVDGVQPTNGVQPLICFLYAPLFQLGGGDLYLALRFVLLLQVLIYAAAVFAIAWYTTALMRPGGPKREVFWLITTVFAWSYTFSNGLLNGLETGLAVAVVFAVLGYYQTRIASEPEASERGLGRYIILGAMLGVAVLTRIDIAFLVAAILLWHLLRAHLRYGSLQGRERLAALGRTLGQCVAVGLTSIIVSSPWWIYNQVTFGSIVPISGQAQQILIRDTGANLEAIWLALAHAVLPTVHTPVLLYEYTPVLVPLGFLLAAVLAVSIGRGWGAVRAAVSGWSRFWEYSATLPLAIFGLALAVYYGFFFGAPHFIVRYLASPRVLIGITSVVFFYLVWRHAPAGSLLRTMLVLLLAGSMIGGGVAMRWNFTDFWGNFFLYPARWIAASVRQPQKVGMFQSGTTGFLSPGIVVNLDGKVNVGALRATQEGRIPAYVDSMRFDYLIDWPEYMAKAFADPAVRARYRAIDTLEGRFIVWKRIAGE